MTETAPNPGPPEWYITTDDAALTLRVTPDLAIGETAGGELALNNAEKDTQWVRFAVHDSGELELLCISDDASIHATDVANDPAPCTRIEVAAGTLIELPNNRLLVSDRFRGQDQNDRPLRIAHEHAYQAPVTSQSARRGENHLVATGLANDLANDTADEAKKAGKSDVGYDGEPLLAAPPLRDANRTKDALARRRDALGYHAAPGATNTTEEALVPVAANAPFDDADLNAYLDSPIDLRTNSSNDQFNDQFNPSSQAPSNDPFRTNTSDFYTQQTAAPIRTGLIPGLSQKQSRGYLYALAGVISVTLIAALAATFLTEPDGTSPSTMGSAALDAPERAQPDPDGAMMPRDSGASNPIAAPLSDSAVTTDTTTGTTTGTAGDSFVGVPTQPAPTQPTPTAQAGTEAMATALPRVQRSTDALLASVDRVLAEGDPSDASVWDFAIQTYEFVLAQEPENQQARDALARARAEQRAIQNNTWEEDDRVIITIEQPALGEATSPPGAAATTAVDPASALVSKADALPALLDRQLDQAEGRLELGQVISPASASAVSLIIGVLEQFPTDRRAINLLNRAADLLLVEADTARVSGNEYLARNILEEIFAFHPRHVGSNERWTEWTGQPPRLPKDVVPETDPDDTEPVIELKQDSPPDLRVPLATP